jgi:hypothetical protein
MRKHFGWVIALAVVLGTAANATQTSQPVSDTFTWVGELVSLDAPAGRITVKARVAYQEALSELKQFKAGERVWVEWSGVSDHSDAVRQFRRPDAHHKIAEALVMPAALVSPEATNQYVALRIQVPEAALAALKSVKPGEWITVTCRHRPATEAEAVVAVKPYYDSSAAASSTTTR